MIGLAEFFWRYEILKWEKIADGQFEKSKTKMADKPSASSSPSCKNELKYKRKKYLDDVSDFV